MNVHKNYLETYREVFPLNFRIKSLIDIIVFS